MKIYSASIKGKKLKKYIHKCWRQTLKGKLFYRVKSINRILKTKDLIVKVVQQVYETNIKKYGILTCYLCLKPILFGQDHLDHKIPISRTTEFPKININNKKNLGITHGYCNLAKYNKTEKEYRMEIKNAKNK